MAFDLEEQEKIDQLKAWWQRYGAWVNAVLMASLLAMVAYYGWQWYQQYQHQNALKQYDALQTLLRQSPLPTQALVETASGLQRDYGSTPHAVRASLRRLMPYGRQATKRQLLSCGNGSPKTAPMWPAPLWRRYYWQMHG